jgi:hypothetical protein
LALTLVALAVAGASLVGLLPVFGSGNSIVIVDSPSHILLYSSIAIGADGFPIISYDDSTASSIDFAHCGSVDCSTGNTLTVVHTTGVSGRSVMAVGSDGLPIVAYHGGYPPGLFVTHCGNADCSSGNSTAQPIADTVLIGAVTVGADGLPLIAFVHADYTNYRPLQLLHCGNLACTSGNTVALVDTVDTGGFPVGLAIGTDGLPVAGYIDFATYSLRVAHCGNASCSAGNTVTVVAGPNSAAWNVSLAIGADGYPVLSYARVPNNDLNVAHCGNAYCSAGNTVVTLDTSGVVGTDSSIAVGTDGLPIVAYVYYNYGDLRVVHCGTADCSSGNVMTTVDNAEFEAVGFGNSMAIGADGLPVISEMDGTARYLKVVHCTTPACSDVKVVPTSTAPPTPFVRETPTPNPVGGIAFESPPKGRGFDARFAFLAVAAVAVAIGGAGFVRQKRG